MRCRLCAVATRQALPDATVIHPSNLLSCAGLTRASTPLALRARKTWIAGHRRAEATPVFERLCTAKTAERCTLTFPQHRCARVPVTTSASQVQRARGKPGVRCTRGL